jgi:hypothetical protein
VTAPEVQTPRCSGAQSTNQVVDKSSIAEAAQSDKAFATLRAELASLGFQVHVVSDGSAGCAYMVQRWALHKMLPDQAAVREFALRAGAAA